MNLLKPSQSAPHSFWSLKLEFLNPNPQVKLKAKDPTSTVISYFKGSPEQWKSGLATYTTLVYEDLWHGIDLVYSGSINRLKYTFVVKPGANPKQIKLAYRGATAVKLDDAGRLAVTWRYYFNTADVPYRHGARHNFQRHAGRIRCQAEPIRLAHLRWIYRRHWR